MTNNKIIKSYVWFKDKCFFVSTIERDSSAMTEPPPMRFNETIVWEYDWEARRRGELLYMDSDTTGSIHTHQKMCLELFKTGKIEESDD